MLRAEFDQRNNGLTLKLEGRLVSAWAVQVKSFVSRHFVPNGLLVDISEVTYVDSVGEQLLLWLRDLHTEFVAESCYARDVCERLHLTPKGGADRTRPVSDRGASLVNSSPPPRPGGLSESPGRGHLRRRRLSLAQQSSESET
jgi:ABC-type transporter Mla MlaB component